MVFTPELEGNVAFITKPLIPRFMKTSQLLVHVTSVLVSQDEQDKQLAKLRKATISFIMSVRPSVYPHTTTRLPLDGF